MPSTAQVLPTADVMLAHPVLQHSGLAFPPLLVASIAAWGVFVVALALPERAPFIGPAAAAASRPLSSWAGRLSPLQLITRALAVVVLLVTIAAARLGVDDQLENLAPALVVGAAWPLLVLVSIGLGPVWRWCDPWDSLARLGTRGEAGEVADQREDAAQVWPAAVLALPWVWYLGATADPLDPRAVGIVLAVYSVVTLAGCVAVGRQRWLATAEPLGILLGWLALLPRGRLAGWQPPRGAEALLGVLVGGVAFGAVRRSQQWTGVDAATGAWAYAALALTASCAAVLLLLVLGRRVARPLRGEAGVARAVVPVVAAVVVAVALGRNRLTSSLQLLPGLIGDPFGRGWDLLGPAVDGLDPAPLGVNGLLTAQVAVLVLGHLIGAVVVAWRLDRRARMPTTVVLALLMAATVVAVPSH